MILFDKVSKEYHTSGRVLHDISLRINAQEFVSIVGHSGAGKTTLLKLLLAEERPTEGIEDGNVIQSDRPWRGSDSEGRLTKSD
jgi:ABC-type ATPase involved in cell division